MRILEIIPGSEEESKASARAVLKAEIEHPGKTVIVIRGNTPEIGAFADKAAGRCDTVPWREAVWVRNEEIFTEDIKQKLFAGKDVETCCAVIVDVSDEQYEFLDAGMSARTIDKLLRKIEEA